MAFWRLKGYSPEPGVNPVRDWYDQQIDEEVRAEFVYALSMLTATADWEHAPDFRPLKKKKFAGLFEIFVDVRVPHEKKKRKYRVIGMWQPDSSDFVLLLVSEKKKGQIYDPPLEVALTFKVDWEQKRKGKIDDYRF